ncbi:helix-turn-helix domain-containing protein [Trichococcus collinsii]|uniref:AraC-type DNA-binding protein n=1 Tax=Trichococcus collinsii TaxID=157076 RepID=A0AB38A2L5_9LACT|nr:AraC family transcriptional regulator [Trichococcus collinsii]CZQ98648.1 transcription regulator hth arac-type [Trichococcus collinsii]SEA79982.1 AraC-type DNA-binding protein [Trichococcus collinsii]
MNLNYLMAYASRKLHTKISLYKNGTEAQSVCKNLELAEQFELNEECSQKLLRYSNKAVPTIVSLNDHYVFGLVEHEANTFIVGPLELSDDYKITRNICLEEWGHISTYRVPTMVVSELVEVLLLIHNLAHEYELIIEELSTYNFEDHLQSAKKNYVDKFFQDRESDVWHNSYQQEIREFDSIMNGDMLKLKESWAEDYGGEMGRLATDDLRNMKNLGIVVITLASRAAMRGGLHPEISYSLSDAFSLEIERLKTVEDITRLIRNAEMEYTLLVHELAKKSRIQASAVYTHPYVNKIQEFILKNLHKDLQIGEIAEILSVTPNYLSALFRKNTGKTIQAYMTEEKMKYAEQLLLYSERPISEISSSIGYSSQSYFGKVFKNFSGYAPSEYKMRFGKS